MLRALVCGLVLLVALAASANGAFNVAGGVAAGASDGMGTGGTDTGPFTINSSTTATLDANSVGTSNVSDGSLTAADMAAGALLDFQVVASNPVDGGTACNTGDGRFNSANNTLWVCVNGGTDDWTQVP